MTADDAAPDPGHYRRTGRLLLMACLAVGLLLAGYAGLTGYFWAACPPEENRLGWSLAVYLGAWLYWWWLGPLVLAVGVVLAALASPRLLRFPMRKIVAGTLGAATMVFLVSFLVAVLAGVHERCGFIW
jgi:hypothetical protein